jgi:hypothetical protein
MELVILTIALTLIGLFLIAAADDNFTKGFGSVMFAVGLIGMYSLFFANFAAAQESAKTTLEVINVQLEIVDEISSGPIGVTATVRCTNENFATSTRCSASPTDSFNFIAAGHFDGYLLSGVYFEQYPITPTLSKMTLEDAFWYIDAKGSFDARSDLFARVEHFVRIYIQK